jgi:hypothetical protein
MSHLVSPAAFERSMVATPRIAIRPVPSCCQQAVAAALEDAASMGAIATMTMLVVGFALGLAFAWLLFG